MDSEWSSSSPIELSDDKEVEDAEWWGESKGVGVEESIAEEVEVAVRRVTGLCLVAEVAIVVCGIGVNASESKEVVDGVRKDRYQRSRVAVGRRRFCWEVSKMK